ncbi:hypothetical protein GCM10009122_39600 [Fulvivirga kasyanovii]|uniref:Uncharacterized protein n=1 Tax=Fulvivirga kasyanovii TaxID=396812 RepID=A0ABW9RI35_9BACT|nr:hypothetical protein [Fulvivirga kasyanovii]MTI23646.1 hypothetical protein [Fulvivirga kasyanovii]
MIFVEIIIILILALLITALFNYGLRAKGPWGNFWTFFLVLACGIWIVAIWTEPVGPVWYGAPWIDFIFVGVLLALILAAATPPRSANTSTTLRPTMNRAKLEEADEETTEPDTVSAIGMFFWLMLLMFLIAIVVGLWL